MTHELSELSRWIAVRQCEGREVEVTADAAERDRLAERFDLVSVESLEATVVLHRKDAVVSAEGRLHAKIVQSCAISGEDLPVSIDEALTMRFVPESEAEEASFDEEIELDADDCDEITYTGDRFDLGEAVAQSLAVAIDPYATGPNADQVRKDIGLEEPEKENPFAALKDLGN
ncbi:DUF177 domain-containing protein [Croceicoccus naphthovorans]|uniref:DNA-binding protein n=1 Tax=Croceicoccus naphthovorans TaxID=1348774 RepID=A0A0G3XEL0_9SPHN|nr:DUF177 domain-containing protein [Croceicoccus naphthovorans]AKM08823.1 DNA-binding protein [Croceicoccus naphthovorans]MBB3991720.1 uncharacterized metal-binding protein YceD (DUF177 family) [Croceicoccus naphthovorans]